MHSRPRTQRSSAECSRASCVVLAATACKRHVRRGSMLADDRPQTTQTAVCHTMTSGESESPIPHQKFARIRRRNISDRLSACSHGLSGLSRRTDIRFATPPHIPITRHPLPHPCPSCRTSTLSNTTHHALYPAQCLTHHTPHHITAHHNTYDIVHTARSCPTCLYCSSLPHPALYSKTYQMRGI